VVWNKKENKVRAALEMAAFLRRMHELHLKIIGAKKNS